LSDTAVTTTVVGCTKMFLDFVFDTARLARGVDGIDQIHEKTR
jgi:hypothetical protein